MSAASSPASADLTTGSPELGFDTPSSVSRTLGGEPSSPITSPEYRSTRTWRLYDPSRTLMPDGTIMENWQEHDVANAITSPPGTKSPLLAFCAEDSPAKMSPSLADVQDSQESDPASSTSSLESLSLFDPDGFSSRTYPVSSLHRAVGTSEQSLERWPTSGTAWRGGFSTHATSECRSDEDGCSSSELSLTEILEEPQNVPARYSLSARAASGILRRAQKRGRTLPSHLSAALEAVARTTTTDKQAAS